MIHRLALSVIKVLWPTQFLHAAREKVLRSLLVFFLLKMKCSFTTQPETVMLSHLDKIFVFTQSSHNLLDVNLTISHKLWHSWVKVLSIIQSFQVSHKTILLFTNQHQVLLMMYSAYKLNKQGDNIQPWCTPFPIWNQSVVPCPVQTVASWPAYRFLKRQVRWSGIPISFRIFRSLLWSTQSKTLA